MRVTVEDRLFGERRLHRLAELLNWSVGTALGSLVLLWHESQARGLSVASPLDIYEWAWLNGDICAPEKWIKSLLQVGFISVSGSVDKSVDNSEKYCIHGNDQVISRINDFNELQREKAKKGGAANKERLERLRARREPEVSPRAKPGSPSTVQSSSEQNSKYNNHPLTPAFQDGGKKGERVKRRLVSDQAAALTAKVIGAVRNQLGPAAAEAFIGRDGWLLVLAEWGNWESFQRGYAVATTEKRSGGSDAMIFKSQLTRSLKALLMQAPETYCAEVPA